MAEALVRWLTTTDVEWDEFDAHNMPVPFGFAEFLVERADDAGLRASRSTRKRPRRSCRCPPDWDAYLASLDSKERHELKRKRRRLGRDHPDASVPNRRRPETLDARPQDLRRHAPRRRGAQGPLHEARDRDLLRAGGACLHAARAGSGSTSSRSATERSRRPSASSSSDPFYLYNSAYEPDASRLSPGLDPRVGPDRRDRSSEGSKHVRFPPGAGALQVPAWVPRPFRCNNVRVVRSSGKRLVTGCSVRRVAVISLSLVARSTSRDG